MLKKLLPLHMYQFPLIFKYGKNIDLYIIAINQINNILPLDPCPAEPGYTLPLQTV